MIIQLLQNAYDGLTHKIEQIESYLNKAPEGYLKVRERNHHFSYFQVTKDAEKEEKVHHLKITDQKELELINMLAHKHYYQRLLPVIKKEHDLIEKFLQEYEPDLKYELFHALVPGRKEIVHPAFRRKSELIHEYVEKWKEEEWEKMTNILKN